MQKKWLALVGAATILAFGACNLEFPQAIELRTKPQLDLPLNPETANLSQMLFNSIKDAMGSSKEITVLDYVGYKVDNQPVQTLLVDYFLQPLGEELSPGFADLLNKIGSSQSIPGFGGITFDLYQGSFPDEDAAEDPIDLSNLSKFLNGFEFTDIESFLYISGPDTLLDGLHLKLSVEYTKDDGTDGSYDIYNDKPEKADPLNLDPTDSGKYSSTLPAKGKNTIDLKTALNDRPEDLRFKYTIGIDDTIDLDNHIDIHDTLKIDILIVFPLALEAGADGANISLKSMSSKEDDEDGGGAPAEEKEPKDILGRKTSGDGSWVEYIKSLSLQLEFSGNIFEGGHVFLDDTVESVGRRIQFPLIEKGLGVSIKGDDLEYINDTVPWDPDVGIYFGAGEKLLIPPNLGAIRLKFDADIQARFDLPGSGK